jgi:UDP-N-acetylmuramoylalanine--D-glutamate ligase
MIPVPGFEGRRVAVFGLGRSGITAARALHAGGAIPILWDDGVSGRMQAEAEGFAVEDLSRADWSQFAALVLSPGAPLTHPKPHWTVDKAKAASVEIIGDIELFARAMARTPGTVRPKVIAITGTNGKSTTTALIGWVLKQAGLKVAVGGNIGIGVLALPAPAEVGVYVIEVSSYQLDLTTSFAPDVAILTNISPDHLDRHGGMEGYVAAKTRIFAHAGLSLVGVDEDWGKGIAAALAAARTVSTGGTPADISASDRRLTVEGETIDLSAARSLPGRHNAQNAAFAWAAARAVGVSHDAAVEGLMTFPGLAHRMEEVARLGKVRFINDSKATNADAARQALSSYERSFWIAGGRAKQGGIDDLEELFPRVVEAFLIGEFRPVSGLRGAGRGVPRCRP